MGERSGPNEAARFLCSDPTIRLTALANLRQSINSLQPDSILALLDELHDGMMDSNLEAHQAILELITSISNNQLSPLYLSQAKCIVDFLLPRILGGLNQKTIGANIELFKQLKSHFPNILLSADYTNVQIIGNYISTGVLLGSGQFSRVYIGRHCRTAQICAIKYIHLRAQSEVACKMIKREVEMMKKIHHPNIVQLYDVIEVPSYLYIVMEYCSGETLDNYISKLQIVPEKDARYIVKETAAGLIYLYKLNIIHRDIKPQNILLNYDSSYISSHENLFHVKLADFTFAKSVGPENLTATFCGTPVYMCPEMFLSNDRGNFRKNGDLWSLGVIFFQMLYGYLPYFSSDILQLVDALRNFKLILPASPTISQETRELLEGLLQKNPSERFSFEELEQCPIMKDKVFREDESEKTLQNLTADISKLQNSIEKLEADIQSSLVDQNKLMTELSQLTAENTRLNLHFDEQEIVVNALRQMVTSIRTSR
eukprot:TRINITY_DN3682_c0_g1_i1.p1 TRINITY_DN3682_c0_g1~~TRINITY_DN3682_c0_g1_i1.p1  ORF type:complete len:492 (-),score=66.78 TRINITY_DN3682_c0_g1_i1:151-1605(-)